MIIIQLTEEQLQTSMKEAVQTAVSSALKEAHNLKDDLLSKTETAKYLGVSTVTLTDWERKGQLNAIRFGHRVYFRKSDLLKKV
jgi:excisionase family DNA binding protein